MWQFMRYLLNFFKISFVNIKNDFWLNFRKWVTSKIFSQNVYRQCKKICLCIEGPSHHLRTRCIVNFFLFIYNLFKLEFINTINFPRKDLTRFFRITQLIWLVIWLVTIIILLKENLSQNKTKIFVIIICSSNIFPGKRMCFSEFLILKNRPISLITRKQFVLV